MSGAFSFVGPAEALYESVKEEASFASDFKTGWFLVVSRSRTINMIIILHDNRKKAKAEDGGYWLCSELTVLKYNTLFAVQLLSRAESLLASESFLNRLEW